MAAITGFDLRNVQLVIDAKSFKALVYLMDNINNKQAGTVANIMESHGIHWDQDDVLAMARSLVRTCEDTADFIRPATTSEDEYEEERSTGNKSVN